MRRGVTVAMAMLIGGLVWVERGMAEGRPAANRPEIKEVGDPVLLSRTSLATEMRRNSDLRYWVRLYGLPEYAEIQQIEIQEPFAPYEVRLFYLKGNRYIVFGRVHVAPSLYDYGVRKYVSEIDQADIDRLLTAQPAFDLATSPATFPETAAPWVVETVPVEGQAVGE